MKGMRNPRPSSPGSTTTKKPALELLTSRLSRAYHIPKSAKRNRLQPWKMTEEGEKLIPEGPFAALKEIESRRGGERGDLPLSYETKENPLTLPVALGYMGWWCNYYHMAEDP